MSEPPAKLSKISGMLQRHGEDDAIGFYLTLCFDVILEVLQFGDRRRLTNLERVGRRFHHLVEKCFGEMPFLCLDIRLEPGDGLEAFVERNEKISVANLATFPPFLRFNDVLLRYQLGSQLLLAKCSLFEGYLNSIKPALKDSNEICFEADINRANPSHFSDHSSLLIYLRDRLLPIFDSSRRYEFSIVFGSDENSAAEFISSILQISQIRSCSNVSIALFDGMSPARLPVEDISNWLTPITDDKVEIFGLKKETRFLQIYSKVQNAQEIWEHLKAKFYEDERPTMPFILQIKGDIAIIEGQKISNRKTNEQLSISHNITYKCIEIKRMQKKNSKPEQNHEIHSWHCL